MKTLIIAFLLVSTASFSQSNYKPFLNNSLANSGSSNAITFMDSASSRDGYFAIGIMTTTTKYPAKFGIEDNPNQGGLMITAPWHMSTIEEVKTSKFGRLCLNIGAEFTIGFAMGESNLKYKNTPNINPDSSFNVKHYTVTADLFSMNANLEYVAYIPGKRTVTAGLAVTFLNIGGSLTYMSGGAFDKNVFGITNIIPLYIQPYGLLKLSGASFGIGVLLNPFSFLEVKYGPKRNIGNQEVMFFDSQASLNFSSTQIAKYAINIYMKF